MKKSSNTKTRAIALTARRDVLKKAAAVGAGFALGGGLLVSRPVRAEAMPQLSEDNAQARALGYRHDAATVDTAKYPMANPAAKNCANCQLFQAQADSEWGGCPLFAGKAVNAKGWCTAWAKKVG